MKFNKKLFVEYKNLIENTNIQESYQYILKFIKYISSNLEKDMINYSFMNRVVENKMDFTYFQMTNNFFKELGLRIQVVFIHKTCTFEVWLSGYNRKIQTDYYAKLSKTNCPFETCIDPNKNDYIIKLPITSDIITDNYEQIIIEIKESINKIEEYFKIIK